MSSDINSKREQLWHRFQKKESRDNWATSHLSTNLATQIFSLREARGWTQRQLAEKVGMAQSRISLMEDPDYESFSLATLKRLASAFDVAFVGRFVAFSELVEWATDLTAERLAPLEFGCDQLQSDKCEALPTQYQAPAKDASKVEAQLASRQSPWAMRPGILDALATNKAHERTRYENNHYGSAIEYGARRAQQALQQG